MNPSIYFTIVAIVLALATARARGQGTVKFDNRSLYDRATGALFNAPVSLPDGSPVTGDQFTAGLFLVEPNGLMLLSTTFFRTAGFFQDPRIISVPDHPSGSSASFSVRVWETAAGSYENAVARQMLHGEFPTDRPDNTVFVQELGPPPPFSPFVDPDLSGIRPLTLQVPEPAFIALLALGGTFFAIARRRLADRPRSRWSRSLLRENQS
jgi:hypothetical protein